MVNVRRIVGLLVLALVIFYIITQPDSAANALHNIGVILRNAAQSIIRFFSRLVAK